jgi:SagB-type dehydrogenase family enzyme
VKKAKSFLSELYEDDLYSLSEIFHENTKLRPSKRREITAKVMRISRDPVILKALTQSYKHYPNLERIILPVSVREDEGVSIEAAILNRRSVRDFDKNRPLTIAQISKLLRFSAGITGEKNLGSGVVNQLRAAPSGGGLYPIEVYPCLLNVADARRGVYHYNVREHSLELIAEAEAETEPGQSPFSIYTPLANPAALFVLTSVFKRSTYKYSHRGYRLVLIEAGHIVENCWLMATAMGLGAVALFSFIDDEVNSLLGVDGVNEAVVYAIAVGHPESDGLAARVAPAIVEGAESYD